jgi:hypothetical protein
MTKTEAYDLACTKVKDPALVEMGGLCVIGEWVLLAEYNELLCILTSKTKGVKVLGEGATWDEAAVKAGLVPVGGDAMLLLAEAEARSFEVSDRSFADVPVTNTRMATVEDLTPPVLARKEPAPILARKEPVTAVSPKSVCRTYGCNAPRTEGNPFCPKCFQEHVSEEHREEREVHSPPPSRRKR